MKHQEGKVKRQPLLKLLQKLFKNKPKDGKDLYAENYKTLIKEIKDDLQK